MFPFQVQGAFSSPLYQRCPLTIVIDMADGLEIPAPNPSNSESQFLCLTICGYRRPGMNEDDYRHHMTKVSAPMTRDLMVKYGVKRWTMVSPFYSHQAFPTLPANLKDPQHKRDPSPHGPAL